MTITIELSSEEETRLIEEAERQGQEPKQVFRGLVRAGLGVGTQSAFPQTEGREDIAQQQRRLAQHLLTQGLISHIPAGRSGPPPRPVPVAGRPVSETLIEDRR